MAETDKTNETYGENDLISLGEKLAALELTEPERAALADLITDDDVGGFGRYGIDLAAGIRIGFRAKRASFGGRAESELSVPDVRAGWGQPGGVRKPGRF